MLKLEDETEDGLNLLDLKNKVEEELRESELESDIKTYVGRTKDGNIQIVVIAENSDATISSQTLANAIEGKLTGT